jgi:hypothetical protein
MEQSPSWEANRFSASQEIPRILWKPKVHNRVYKCPQPVLIVSTFKSLVFVLTPSSPPPPRGYFTDANRVSWSNANFIVIANSKVQPTLKFPTKYF